MPLRANIGGEDLAEVDPDDRALRKSEEDDEADKQGKKQLEVLIDGEDIRDAGERKAGADRADEEQGLAAELIDDGDAEQGGDEVGGADHNGLVGARDRGKAGAGEDVIEIVENGVDAGELIEEADGDGEKDQQLVAGREEGVLLGAAFGTHGGNHGVHLGLGVWRSHAGKDELSFVDAILGDEPAGALGNAEQEKHEEERGDDGDTELHAPLDGAKSKVSDDGVGEVGEQDANDDVDLEHADEATAPLGGGELRDVDGAEDGGAADAEAAQKAEGKEGPPGAREGATGGRDDVEDAHDAESGAAADALAERARKHSAKDGAVEGDGDGEALLALGESVVQLKRVGGASDDGGIKAEEKAAKSAGESTLNEQKDGFRLI